MVVIQLMHLFRLGFPELQWKVFVVGSKHGNKFVVFSVI